MATKWTRFPKYQANDEADKNLAVSLFGRRFYRDQTEVEYLAEFLLVLASPKYQGEKPLIGVFPELDDKDNSAFRYRPPHGVPLKLMAFFSTSKLETRHESHRLAFERGLGVLQEGLAGSDQEKSDFVRGLQSLLNGFVGVSGNRTWVTQTFLPVTRSMLAREVMWKHSAAKTNDSKYWDKTAQYFEVNKHNFFARGGEQLYLQLLQLFRHYDDAQLVEIRNRPEYRHLPTDGNVLRKEIEDGLDRLLNELEGSLGRLTGFVSEAMLGADLDMSAIEDSTKQFATLGWVPSICLPEAMLFAAELRNLLTARVDPLRRIESLQLLCALHPLRSLSFQAARHVPSPAPLQFVGQYAWVVSPPMGTMSELRRLSERSYERVEMMLQQALRVGEWPHKPPSATPAELDKADEQSHQLLRRLGKALAVVIPPKGPGTRFNLPEAYIRMLVPALLPSQGRLSEEEFMRRLYMHYGIVLGGALVEEAAAWTLPDSPPKSDWEAATWFTEALRSGGFLIPLSDAVSMIKNPQ